MLQKDNIKDNDAPEANFTAPQISADHAPAINKLFWYVCVSSMSHSCLSLINSGNYIACIVFAPGKKIHSIK